MKMTDLLAAINKTPQDPTLWNQMGVLSVEQNDLETAQTCFETLVALAPKSAISWIIWRGFTWRPQTKLRQ